MVLKEENSSLGSIADQLLSGELGIVPIAEIVEGIPKRDCPMMFVLHQGR